MTVKCFRSPTFLSNTIVLLYGADKKLECRTPTSKILSLSGALSMSHSAKRYQDDDHCLRVPRRLVDAAEYLLRDGATEC